MRKQAYNVPLMLYIPKQVTAKGSTKNVYPTESEIIYCSFKTFGGTENFSNDTLVVEDTAVIETWYRPDIKSDCRIQTVDGKRYEILGTPENINMQCQIMRFKIRAIKGGA